MPCVFIALPAASARAQAPDRPPTGYQEEYKLYKAAIANREASKAMRHARASYRLARQELEPGNKTLGVLAFNLGAAYFELKRYSDARSSLEEATQLYAAAHGEGAEASLAPIMKLARVDRKLERWVEAERGYVRAIDIIEEHRGRDDEEIAKILGQLMPIAAALDKPKRVRSYGLRALHIHSETKGEDDLESAWIHLDLARNEVEHGEYVTARKHIHAAAPVLEKKLPPGDPRLADAYRFLAQFYEVVGNIQVSRRYREKAKTLTQADDPGR